jgi:hypothetical protein
MVDVIPGSSIGLGQMSGAVTTVTTIVGYIALFLVAGGAVFGIMWFLNKKILRFTIPVTLKFEVGGTILQKQDMIWIKRSGDKWQVEFQKNPRLIAPIPDDQCAFMKSAGLKSIKTFEGFVRNNQVAWTWPQPQTRIVKPESKQIVHIHPGDVGQEVVVPAQNIETFQTIPTNMVEAYINQLSKNKELLLKKKWYQDPVALQWGAMILFFVAVIFIYLMCKNIPDLVNGYLAFAKTLATNCQGVQIR